MTRRAPLDLAHLARYDDAPREVPARYPLPGPLTLAELDGLLAGAGRHEGARWERVARGGDHPGYTVRMTPGFRLLMRPC